MKGKWPGSSDNSLHASLFSLLAWLWEVTTKQQTPKETTRKLKSVLALFAWLISCIFLVNEQYFSLTTNQSIVLSAMTFQPSEQGNCQQFVLKKMLPLRQEPPDHIRINLHKVGT